MRERYFRTGCDLLDMVTGGDKGVYGFPEGRFVNIVGDKSSGKAQPLYSKVLTPTGWKTMGDIHVGDLVCVPSGGTAEVIGEFPQGKRPIYEFTFNDGTSVRSADNHYWVVQSVNQALSTTVFNKKNGCSLVTTQDIVELSKNGLDKPSNRLYLPYVEPVAFEQKNDLPIDPYLTGILIADGGITTSSLTISINEQDILDKVKDLLDNIGYELVKLNNCDYRIRCKTSKTNAVLQDKLRSIGLFGKKSVDKSIPAEYLYSSVENREQLLFGLFDGDGYITKGGNLEYSTSSKKLADDVCELVRSLGGYCAVRKKTSPFYIKDGKRVYCNTSYTVSIRFRDFLPYTSKKHEAKYSSKNKVSYNRLSNKVINSVTYIGEEECKCIYIAHPEHLYITDNYTVTHNTFLSNEIIASAYYTYPKGKFKWVYDDCERGYSFDTQSMYGFDIIPSDPEKVVCSSTVEEAFCNIANFADSLEDDQFGIYVLDSLDGLTSEEQNSQADDRLKAFNNGKEYDKGSYGMGKPKYLSREFFPQLCSKIQDKHILVIIISQVRDNVDMFSFEKFKRSGGKALDFYAHMVLWLATAKKITKKERTVGVVVKAKVTKGKVPRPFRECFFSFIYDYGLDNTGTSIDYLYDLRTATGELSSSAKSIRWGNDAEKPTVPLLRHWLEDEGLTDRFEGKKPTVDNVIEFVKTNPDYRKKFEERFGMVMTREELINYIEDSGLQEELRRKVEDKWEESEDAIRSSRRKKYANQPVSTDNEGC